MLARFPFFYCCKPLCLPQGSAQSAAMELQQRCSRHTCLADFAISCTSCTAPAMTSARVLPANTLEQYCIHRAKCMHLVTACRHVQGQQCPLRWRCQQRHRVQCSCLLEWRRGQSIGRWVLFTRLRHKRDGLHDLLVSAWHMVDSRAHQHRTAFSRIADTVCLCSAGFLMQVSAGRAQMLGTGSAEVQAPRPEASLPVEVQTSGHAAGAEAPAPRQAGDEMLAPRLVSNFPADTATNARPPTAGAQARPGSSGLEPPAASSDAAASQARPATRGEQWQHSPSPGCVVPCSVTAILPPQLEPCPPSLSWEP